MPPRFSPREWIDPPKAFSDSRLTGRWLEPSTHDEAVEVLTARYLSEIAREIDRSLRERGWRRKHLAESIGEDPNVVRRKLNGEYPASLEDIVRWTIALDHVEVIFAPGSVSELFPPSQEGHLRRLLGQADPA